MSPIQLGTWAQLWILGLTAHSGGGLTLRTAEGVFRAQILPNAAWRIVGQRSGVSWEDQRSQFHVGQTPYGPGYSVQGTLSTGLFLAYLGSGRSMDSMDGATWTGPSKRLLQFSGPPTGRRMGAMVLWHLPARHVPSWLAGSSKPSPMAFCPWEMGRATAGLPSSNHSEWPSNLVQFQIALRPPRPVP